MTLAPMTSATTGFCDEDGRVYFDAANVEANAAEWLPEVLTGDFSAALARSIAYLEEERDDYAEGSERWLEYAPMVREDRPPLVKL